MFLRLTLTDDRPVLINSQRVDSIVRYADDSYTAIYMPGENNTVCVKEPLDDVSRMLYQASQILYYDGLEKEPF